MESRFDRYMREVLDSVEQAEIVCVIFPILNQCLIYDGRHLNDDPPRITISQPLGSAERRLRQLNRARPNVPKATELTAFPWAGTVTSLVQSGIWDKLINRVIASGFPAAADTFKTTLNELLAWEHRFFVSLISGEGPFHTLWSRRGHSS